MAQEIVVYGHGDESKLGFPTPEDFSSYIKHDIFAINNGRYRYTRNLDAHVIVLSRKGLAYGHFDIASQGNPTGDDRHDYPPVKCVYLVRKSTLYEKPVKLFPLGIKNFRYGRTLSDEEFGKILAQAGHTQEFEADCALAEELPVAKYPEGATVRILVNAYERNQAARAACKAHYGIRCQVCDLDFGERYGEIGKGFIQVHHLKQLADVGEQYEVDPVADLRPVCPNCHAMLHLKKPPLSIDELKLRINRSHMR
jgi:hypothetical protein